jgi:HEAT repeat protein
VRGPGAAPGPRTGGDAGVDVDLTTWDFWWGFNKDPYINLRVAIHEGATATGLEGWWIGKGEEVITKDLLRPTLAQVRDEVVPALLRVLESERDNDLLTGALIALAKIGDIADGSGESRFAQAFRGFLDDPSQEVSETAALALGILAHRDAVEPLVALMRDDPAGRRLVGTTQVSLRTRAFAAFGLGLVGHRSSDPALRADVAEHLVDVLESPHFAMRDLKVAAMTAFGLTPLDPVEWTGELPADVARTNRRHVRSRQTQLEFLRGYFDEAEARKHKGSRHWFVRAHAPTAMARLLEDPGLGGAEYAELREDLAQLMLDAVGARSPYKQAELRQSAILALGRVGTAADGGLDDRIREALTELSQRPGEQQSKRFALIALGLSAGRTGPGPRGGDGRPAATKKLLSTLSRGATQERPWAALALGVQVRAQLDAGETPDSGVLAALRRAAADCKSAENVGGHVLALGLARDVESTEMLLERLDDLTGRDGARGYVALALGMIGHTSAVERIQEILVDSAYRRELLQQCAIALGLLGDKSMVPELIRMLREAPALSSQAALASALGTIGDRRSIEPLVAFLADSRPTDRARGFAAVALGIVCDKEDLPWNSKIAVGVNYRASTVTLTGNLGTGVLDIL